MVRVADLFALQEVDSQIDALQRTLDELRSRADVSEELQAAEERLAELEGQRSAIDAEQRQAGYEVDDLRTQAEAVEAKLYGGGITSAKELRDLQRDLESIQKRLREREEHLLGVMTRIEELRTEIEATRNAIQSGRAAWELEQQEASVRTTEIEQEIAALSQRRARAAAPIDQPSLALYERLRRTRGGRAVARVERGACLGCRIALPSNVFQKARSGATVVQCSSCERILFVG